MSLSPTPTIFSPLQSSKNSGDLPKNKKKKKEEEEAGLNMLFHCLKPPKIIFLYRLISVFDSSHLLNFSILYPDNNIPTQCHFA